MQSNSSMKKELIQRNFINGTALLLIILWAYTGTSKLLDIDNFMAIIAMSPVIGKFAENIAILVPVTELALVVALTVPPWREYGLLGSALLLTVLTAYIIYMKLFAAQLPCSCGGFIKAMTWSQHLAFNIFFMMLAAGAWWLAHRRKLFTAVNRNSRIPV